MNFGFRKRGCLVLACSVGCKPAGWCHSSYTNINVQLGLYLCFTGRIEPQAVGSKAKQVAYVSSSPSPSDHASLGVISHLGAVPPILISKCMLNQAQVERKGLQIGLECDLRLALACHGRAIVPGCGCWLYDDGVFPLPPDFPLLSSPVWMSHAGAWVTAGAPKRDSRPSPVHTAQHRSQERQLPPGAVNVQLLLIRGFLAPAARDRPFDSAPTSHCLPCHRGEVWPRHVHPPLVCCRLLASCLCSDGVSSRLLALGQMASLGHVWTSRRSSSSHVGLGKPCCTCVRGRLSAAYLVEVLSQHGEGLGGLTMPGTSPQRHVGAKHSGNPRARAAPRSRAAFVQSRLRRCQTGTSCHRGLWSL